MIFIPFKMLVVAFYISQKILTFHLNPQSTVLSPHYLPPQYFSYLNKLMFQHLVDRFSLDFLYKYLTLGVNINATVEPLAVKMYNYHFCYFVTVVLFIKINRTIMHMSQNSFTYYFYNELFRFIYTSYQIILTHNILQFY